MFGFGIFYSMKKSKDLDFREKKLNEKAEELAKRDSDEDTPQD